MSTEWLVVADASQARLLRRERRIAHGLHAAAAQVRARRLMRGKRETMLAASTTPSATLSLVNPQWHGDGRLASART